MEIGINIYGGIDIEKQLENLKKHGIKKTFLMGEKADFDKTMSLLQEYGIKCENLHAPFDKINDMWKDDEDNANDMSNRLKDSIDKCARYNIPVTVMHISSGKPMPEINEKGLARFSAVFEYANKKGVKIALENQRFLENLWYFLDKFDSLGFCWDCGHENGFTKGIKFMELFSERLAALHIHDNRCGIDTDDHLIPFDGKIDFEYVAKAIAHSDFDGTLMLEISKNANIDGKKVYENMDEEEYMDRAAAAVLRLSEMIERNKEQRR